MGTLICLPLLVTLCHCRLKPPVVSIPSSACISSLRVLTSINISRYVGQFEVKPRGRNEKFDDDGSLTDK